MTKRAPPELKYEINAVLPGNKNASLRTLLTDIVDSMGSGSVTPAPTPAPVKIKATDIATVDGTPKPETILHGDNTWKDAPIGFAPVKP